MEAQIRIGAGRAFTLKQALLIYRDESSAFVTLHEVQAEKDKTPYLGPGQSLTTAFLRTLTRGLLDYYGGIELADDAVVLCLDWVGRAAAGR